MSLKESTPATRRMQSHLMLGRILISRILISGLLLPCLVPGAETAESSLQQGFDNMYNLSFDAAHQSFEGWERSHPADARGPVFDAAAYLFSEFDRLRILQSEFFVDDDNFFHRRRPLTADPRIKTAFDNALSRTKTLADATLRASPVDKAAMFANVLRMGLRADYTALIEKRNVQALSEVKEARESAQALLRLDPSYYDAYLALGVENYLLSQKPAPVRWLLHMEGAQTDKDTGITNLKKTAAQGTYLQPYAELLLAVAALRDKDTAETKRLLTDLARRFPRNILYKEELKKIS